MKKGVPGCTCVALAAALLLAACMHRPRPARGPHWTPANAMKRSPAPALADDQPVESLLEALKRNVERLAGLDAAAICRFGRDPVPRQRLAESLADFQAKLAEMGMGEPFFRYLRENYLFYRSVAKPVLFTGYYEPLLSGARERSERFPYPLYRRPGDLVVVDLDAYSFFKEHPDLPRQIRGRLTESMRVVPYYSREEIDFQNKLAERQLEILWVNDLIDIFFLQIQGSGIVRLESGETVRVNYADSNGHPYRSIGRHLIERGKISRDQGSLQGIRSYLRSHPEEWREILNVNPSYIFFEVGETGPIGSFGVPLTAYRSLATDRYLFPQGALAWIETEKPVLDAEKRIVGWQKFGRFVLNQDTGGAIRGPGRADLFTGAGEEAEIVAGHMMQKGSFYFLLKK